LDIGRLFVQQLETVLDSAAFDRYIANHMANQRSQQNGNQENTMNRIRLLAIGTMLMFTLTVVAQQAATQPDRPADHPVKDDHGHGGAPTVEMHLKVLSEKLDLTGDQQAKIKPILQELHDATQKLVQDKNMSHEERMGNARVSHEKADKKIRPILNDDQKKKLDQLEQERHPELHGNVSGATPPAAGAPQN
jgi:Spy/CpxP family protein refolding chaperone